MKISKHRIKRLIAEAFRDDTKGGFHAGRLARRTRASIDQDMIDHLRDLDYTDLEHRRQADMFDSALTGEEEPYEYIEGKDNKRIIDRIKRMKRIENLFNNVKKAVSMNLPQPDSIEKYSTRQSLPPHRLKLVWKWDNKEVVVKFRTVKSPAMWKFYIVLFENGIMSFGTKAYLVPGAIEKISELLANYGYPDQLNEVFSDTKQGIMAKRAASRARSDFYDDEMVGAAADLDHTDFEHRQQASMMDDAFGVEHDHEFVDIKDPENKKLEWVFAMSKKSKIDNMIISKFSKMGVDINPNESLKDVPSCGYIIKDDQNIVIFRQIEMQAKPGMGTWNITVYKKKPIPGKGSEESFQYLTSEKEFHIQAVIDRVTKYLYKLNMIEGSNRPTPGKLTSHFLSQGD